MKEKINLHEELNRVKDLFGYKKGQVISEQNFNKFNPNDNYPSLGIGGGDKSKLTPKQIEAASAGWGPVEDEYAKTLKVGPDGKILPKPVKGSTKEEYPECVRVFGNPKASQSGKQFSINGTGDWKDFFFFPNGFYGNFSNTSSKPPHGKYSCKGNVISVGPLDSEKTITPVKPKPVVQIPKELKDENGVKKFQDWMDTNHPNWVKGKNLNKGGGYGKFGPSTEAAWEKYKNKYYSGAPLKVTTPGITDADAPVDDTQVNNYAAKAPSTDGMSDEENPYLMYSDNAPRKKF